MRTYYPIFLATVRGYYEADLRKELQNFRPWGRKKTNLSGRILPGCARLQSAMGAQPGRQFLHPTKKLSPMKKINDHEELAAEIEKRFKFRREYLEFLESHGFSLSETVLSNHLAGRKNLTEWHKIAYSFSLAYFDSQTVATTTSTPAPTDPHKALPPDPGPAGCSTPAPPPASSAAACSCAQCRQGDSYTEVT